MHLNEEPDKAKRYVRIKYCFMLINMAYLFVLIFFSLFSGLSNLIAQQTESLIKPSLFCFPVYLFLIFLFYNLFELPLNFYSSFKLEHKFNLTNQKLKDWCLDQLKTQIITYIITLLLFSVFYLTLKTFVNSWWFIVSIFWIFFSLILAKVFPIIIIPLFFKYKKLTDENLRARIFNLAKKIGVSILDVFEIDFSKKTLKANAAFVGWGKTRRVILADTLKDKYTYEEIEVILAHEMAHYKLKHLIKLVVINSIVTIISFYLIFMTSSSVLRYFRFSSLSEIAAFPIIILYLSLLELIVQPIQNLLSRIMERNADRKALEVTALKEAFISTMEKLANQNLADRKPHPIIKFLFFDHPAIDERIKMAQDYK